jgi:hypothetical protein
MSVTPQEVMGPAPLPGRAGQGGRDRYHQARLGVGGDQHGPGQPAGGQAAEERQPSRAVLGAGDLQTEDLSLAVRMDRGGTGMPIGRGQPHCHLSDRPWSFVKPDQLV